MKVIVFLYISLSISTTWAQTLMESDKVTIDDNQAILVRTSKTPRDVLIIMNHQIIDHSRRGACIRYTEERRNGPHTSCPPEVYREQQCVPKKSQSEEILSGCKPEGQQDCKIQVERTWKECQFIARERQGSCDYYQRVCAEYEHPALTRLTSIKLKFSKNSLLIGDQQELIDIGFEVSPNRSNPRWNIEFIRTENNYRVQRKEGRRLLSDNDPYYLISKE